MATLAKTLPFYRTIDRAERNMRIVLQFLQCSGNWEVEERPQLEGECGYCGWVGEVYGQPGPMGSQSIHWALSLNISLEPQTLPVLHLKYIM